MGRSCEKSSRSGRGTTIISSPLPYEELDYEDRIGRAMADASYRGCAEYEPKPFPVTPPEGRLEFEDRAWMSRLIKKVGMMFGADIVRITELDQRWVYKEVDIPHPYAIVVAVQHKPSLVNLAPSYFSWGRPRKPTAGSN